MTIIEDGYLSQENLKQAGKDETWLNQVLRENHAETKETLLLTVDAADKVLWLGKEYDT